MVVYSTSFSGFSKNKPAGDYFNSARGDCIDECNRAVTVFGIMASASNSNATTTTLSGLINHNADQTTYSSITTPSLQGYSQDILVHHFYYSIINAASITLMGFIHGP